jgi:hypothetical protein
MHERKGRVDAGHRAALLVKANELRMVTIAGGSIQQDLARQQRLAPERHQPDRVQGARMNGPETHAVTFPEAPQSRPVRV